MLFGSPFFGPPALVHPDLTLLEATPASSIPTKEDEGEEGPAPVTGTFSPQHGL